MKSGIRIGYLLHLSSYPKQPVGYLPTSLQPFSRQPNRFVLVHRIADETLFMQSVHGLEVEPFQVLPVSKLKAANRASTASSISLSSYSMIVAPGLWRAYSENAFAGKSGSYGFASFTASVGAGLPAKTSSRHAAPVKPNPGTVSISNCSLLPK